MKIVIIGGVAGGATALARLRRLDAKAEIVLFERGKYVSFANCGLPYYVGGAIPSRQALFVTTKESMENNYGVDIRVESEVLKINPGEKTLEVYDRANDKHYTESYDKLLLSTGSRPFVPPVPGTDNANVFQLWTVPDVDRIVAFIDQKQPKHAVVVGGGFIGLEMAENLVERGLRVTVVEMAEHVLPPLDGDMAKMVENHMVEKGITLKLGKAFAGMSEDGRQVMLGDGQALDADMVILSIGVRPNNELAKDAGLELSQRGGVVVDDYMRTSDPDIYAVGDVISVKDYVMGNPTMIPLAGPANKQGRAVAANILGLKPESYQGTMGTSVLRMFDLTAASVGANEKTLTRAGKVYGKDYFIALSYPKCHAGYFPGALPLALKVIFDKDGKVLGAQSVGYSGVDKRIDVLATLIHFHGTVEDLSQLELAYAPPYSSAKDPVNFAGYMGLNILQGLTDPILYREWAENPEAYTLLDIREPDETLIGTIPGAVLIPLSQLRKRHNELDKSKTYVVFCAVGRRGFIGERILKQAGFKVKNLAGGIQSYKDMEQDTTMSINLCHQTDNPTPSTNKTAAAAVSEQSAKLEILDVCGLSCPGPIVQVAKALEKMNDGDQLDVTASDPGFARDIAAWCNNTGNTLLSSSSEKGRYKALVQKGLAQEASLTPVPGGPAMPAASKEKTMIIFDNDLDKAIAAFIIATGAAAMGNKVHMFFTFWGLSILRKPQAPPVKKDFMGKMFGMMLPKGSKKLGLSQMNMAGAGAMMIRNVMKQKGVDSLETLIQQAIEAGVELIACQMTMDIMGLKQEELLDGVQIGGVATMLNDSDNSNMNLFI